IPFLSGYQYVVTVARLQPGPFQGSAATVQLRCQSVDQAGAIRTAPASDQVIACLTRERAIAAADDVMENACVARSQTKRVKGRVDKSDRRVAVRGRLLIGQRQVSSPSRSGKAGSAPASLASAV